MGPPQSYEELKENKKIIAQTAMAKVKEKGVPKKAAPKVLGAPKK